MHNRVGGLNEAELYQEQIIICRIEFNGPLKEVYSSLNCECFVGGRVEQRRTYVYLVVVKE